MQMKFIKNDFQKEICDRAISILEDTKRVGLDVFTSGGKSIIASEIVEHLRSKGIVKKVLVVAKEGTWCALSSRMTQIGFSLDNVYHIKNSKLSRRTSLKDCIEEQGISSDDIDLILFDECHQLFGTNIRCELNKYKDYIYSKYVIAMTATTYTGLKMIDSLKEIVGESNIVKFNLNDAVARDVIDPINMVEIKLSCKPEYYERINGLLCCKNSNVTNKKILRFADATKRYVDKANIDTLSNVIYQSIVTNAKKYKVNLDASNGARVLVFFNRIDDIRKYKEYIVNAVSKAYTGATINYIEYTSKSSTAESDEAIKVLTANKADKNTVDIVVTCDVGAESFHPVNIQLGLVFGNTQSIRKAIQRIGRFITLKQYKTSDYIILDFSESDKVGRTTITTGKTELDYRSEEINNLKRYFTDSESDIESLLSEYGNSINIEVSSIDISILDRLDRLNVLVNVTVDNDDLLAFIDSKLDVIEKKYYGNIAKYLKENESKYPEITEHNYRQRFNSIRKYMAYPGLQASDFEILNETFGKYGSSLYLGENTSTNMTGEVRVLYRKIKAKSCSIEDIYRPFVRRQYTSDCIALIRSDKDMLMLLYKRICNSVPSCYNINKDSVLYNKLILVNKLCKNHIDNCGLDGVGKELAVMLAVYLDTYYSISNNKEIKNVVSTYLTMMRDLGLKTNKISGEYRKSVKPVFEVDVVRHIAKLTNTPINISNSRIENSILRLCCEKRTKLQNKAIMMCISGSSNDTPEMFIQDGLEMTKAYRLMTKACETKHYRDIKALIDFKNTGGYIPVKLAKQFGLDKLTKKYENMVRIKSVTPTHLI